LFCDQSLNLKFIWPDVGALTLGKAEDQDCDRLPAQENDRSEAAGFAFSGTPQPLFINASAKIRSVREL
jgi:hypothetical protein